MTTLVDFIWVKVIRPLSRCTHRQYGIFILCLLGCLYLMTSRSTVFFKRHVHDCDCPSTDGQTELEQMTRFWTDKTHNHNSEASVFELAELTYNMGIYDHITNKTISTEEYSYQFSSAHLFIREDGYTIAKFIITEMVKGHLTLGGATFKIIIKSSHTRNSCGYRDNFDGSYIVCCVVREPESEIEFYLMNVDFKSYDLYYSHHELIYTAPVERLSSVNAVGSSLDDGSGWCYPDQGFWVSVPDDTSGWRLTKKNKLTHFFKKAEIDQCFNERYSHIMFAGDSHLRAAFGYLQQLRETTKVIIDKEMTHNMQVVFADDMTFYVSTLVSILTDNLKLILADAEAKLDMEEEGTKPRLLVFNSGCHDLAFNDSAMYMTEFKEAFKVLQEIKDTGMFKIVFQNLTPWPHDMEHDRDRHLNTFVSAATSYWVTQKLQQLDVAIVDIRTLALPFEDMSTCGMHYLCPDVPNEPQGAAGKEAVHQILQAACTM